MYEHRRHPMLTRTQFAKRMLAHFTFSATLVAVSLFVGMWGYHHFEGLSWLDGFVNASMLLGGMGPVNELHTDAGKLFAGCYALYAGLVFLIVAGVLLAPVIHRIAHKIHLVEQGNGE
ncbi:MAG TPA: hypothetical protein VFI39_00555 [Gemmatimonadales bacterium]|nr:hypothetical protein [Gemmatimonadales bacterium]